MNTATQMATTAVEIIKQQERKFLDLNAANGGILDFAQECLFARQQILKSDFTLKIATNNPQSLQAAILNVSAIGISLNPASQHAYLVPRDNAICLDISYRGLVKIATDSGAIKWAKVELVYENDVFKWRGPAEAPQHEADPFSDRGDMKGGYCLAKLPDGEMMTEIMTLDDILKVRDTSKAYQSKKGPWIDWFDEMAKKTVLKRASKSWPQTANRQRVDMAVEALHQSEGCAYTIEQQGDYFECLNNGDALGFYMLKIGLSDGAWMALYNSFPKGEKVTGKDKAAALEKAGVSQFTDIKSAMQDATTNNDEMGMKQLVEELTQKEKEFMYQWVPAEVRAFAEQVASA